MKQIESRREGTRRIIDMPDTPPRNRKALEKLYKTNDPLDLHDECERGLKHIFELLCILREKEPITELDADKLSQLQGKLTLRYAPFQLALKRQKIKLRPAS